MKLLKTLVLIGGGVYLFRRLRPALTVGGVGAPATSAGAAPTASSLRDVATRSGIADVDPQPLSQVVEALDPDATAAAHTELRDLHDRLPR